MKTNFTEHARKRMKQRAISELMIRLIQEYGVEVQQKHGSVALYVPDDAIRTLRTAVDRLGGIRLIETDSGSLITAMHDTERLKRPA